jgi:hypothetical protein
MACQPVSPFDRNGALNTGFSRQHRAQGLSPFPIPGSEIGSVVSGLPTLDGAAIQRRPLSPRVTVHTRLLKSNTSPREQAHNSRDLARRAAASAPCGCWAACFASRPSQACTPDVAELAHSDGLASALPDGRPVWDSFHAPRTDRPTSACIRALGMRHRPCTRARQYIQ